jgi:3-phenylpropionate/trans-cinnamate dioxygenase ferredoxin reductase subunit
MSTSKPQDIVIVGASLAGGRAAAELRERGFDGHIRLIGAESQLPYERPPLSKDYLRGESDLEAALVHDETWWDEHRVELLLDSTATAIDAGAGRVTLADGRELGYDALLLATGARPRQLGVPGTNLDGLYYLRTAADADALRARLQTGGHLVVVGAGWIGCEVAASARQLGAEVTVIDPGELPNVRVFGSEVAGFYRDVHVQHGVHFVLGDEVSAFEGDGKVEAVHTRAGEIITCDAVLVAVGAAPNVELAQAAGLKVDGGIVVDGQLRSSAPAIYAAGDVAKVDYSFYGEHIRLEHWSAALEQGPAAARSILGDEAPYDVLPYFFSDQYDVGMEYSGLASPDDQVVFRGERDSGEFIAFWLRDGVVVAGMNVNVWDVNEHVQKLIRSRRVVDVAKLTDPDTDLGTLVDAIASGH